MLPLLSALGVAVDSDSCVDYTAFLKALEGGSSLSDADSFKRASGRSRIASHANFWRTLLTVSPCLSTSVDARGVDSAQPCAHHGLGVSAHGPEAPVLAQGPPLDRPCDCC